MKIRLVVGSERFHLSQYPHVCMSACVHVCMCACVVHATTPFNDSFFQFQSHVYYCRLIFTKVK